MYIAICSVVYICNVIAAAAAAAVAAHLETPRFEAYHFAPTKY